MPIVRFSNEVVRLNQPNNFQQTVSAPTVTTSTITTSAISISGKPALGSQGAIRPEDFTEIHQVIDYVERIKQALVNMGVMS